MLRRGKDGNIQTFGYLISVEIAIDDSTTPEQVALRLPDAVTWMDGVGAVDVENLGRVNVYPEEEIVSDGKSIIHSGENGQ